MLINTVRKIWFPPVWGIALYSQVNHKKTSHKELNKNKSIIKNMIPPKKVLAIWKKNKEAYGVTHEEIAKDAGTHFNTVATALKGKDISRDTFDKLNAYFLKLAYLNKTMTKQIISDFAKIEEDGN